MIEIKNFNNLSEPELWQIKKIWNDEVGFIYPFDDKVFNHHVINSKFLVKNASFIAFLLDVPIGFIIAKTFDTGEISAYRDRSWISLFYVSKHYRKQGAGSLLLEKCLNELEEKAVRVSQSGFIMNQFFMEKMMYKIQSDILNLRDMTKEVYLSLNLNQVYQVEIGKSNMILFLDNDTEVQLSL